MLKQLSRAPLVFPKMRFREKREKIEDYTVEDIEWITTYNHRETLKMEMVA